MHVISIHGYHQLDNGMSYLGVSAGGDWERSVFFIIYYDSETLRGYVPKYGNTWNTKTNKAFGNEDDEDDEASSDESNIRARAGEFLYNKEKDVLGLTLSDIDMNTDLIIEDIKARFAPVPSSRQSDDTFCC